MPLLDHFHAPLTPARHWESFHVNWAGAMADALNERLLPPGYFAEEQTHRGARVEIDVATYETEGESSPAPRNGGVATLPARTWLPPAPAFVVPAAFPEGFEVLVFDSEGGARLVAAVELVSPSNKDRPAHRRAFAIKCASYLCQGIGLVVVDIVTSRQANMHNAIMELLGGNAEAVLPPDALLYATAYPAGSRIEDTDAPGGFGPCDNYPKDLAGQEWGTHGAVSVVAFPKKPSLTSSIAAVCCASSTGLPRPCLSAPATRRSRSSVKHRTPKNLARD